VEKALNNDLPKYLRQNLQITGIAYFTLKTKKIVEIQMGRSKHSGKATITLAMGDKPKEKGYTKKAGSSATARNCKSVGGRMVNGKCVGGVL